MIDSNISITQHINTAILRHGTTHIFALQCVGARRARKTQISREMKLRYFAAVLPSIDVSVFDKLESVCQIYDVDKFLLRDIDETAAKCGVDPKVRPSETRVEKDFLFIIAGVIDIVQVLSRFASSCKVSEISSSRSQNVRCNHRSVLIHQKR
jgi:hypothetical protein